MKKFSRHTAYFILILIMLALAVSCSLNKPEKSKPRPKPTSSQQTPKPKPPDVSKIISQGVKELEADQVNKAIASFEKAKKNDPKNAEAAQYLKKAMARREELIQQHLKQGTEYFRREQLQEAMREWNAILALDPNHPQALNNKERTQKMLDALQE
ncbi:flp pilus assembly protein TadD [Candidatus Vecturithrix granuli]|uniref:Flp pilus assembly protein TadD n=1 Tax=Vecturithrix granuli TaxID=1499967 RepID=A0A081BZL0_VECG1|nr:flp pilus assembly protein TadD [Candidatus Vecturithrix granuli]